MTKIREEEEKAEAEKEAWGRRMALGSKMEVLIRV